MESRMSFLALLCTVLLVSDSLDRMPMFGPSCDTRATVMRNVLDTPVNLLPYLKGLSLAHLLLTLGYDRSRDRTKWPHPVRWKGSHARCSATHIV